MDDKTTTIIAIILVLYLITRPKWIKSKFLVHFKKNDALESFLRAFKNVVELYINKRPKSLRSNPSALWAIWTILSYFGVILESKYVIFNEKED